MQTCEKVAERLKSLSPADFLNLGRHEFVYVRPMTHEGEQVYGVHDANGDTLFVHPSKDAALTLARQNNLHPFTLH